eukprot:1157937-Pelagomonas_calceolata.AAC.2
MQHSLNVDGVLMGVQRTPNEMWLVSVLVALLQCFGALISSKRHSRFEATFITIFLQHPQSQHVEHAHFPTINLKLAPWRSDAVLLSSCMIWPKVWYKAEISDHGGRYSSGLVLPSTQQSDIFLAPLIGIAVGNAFDECLHTLFKIKSKPSSFE